MNGTEIERVSDKNEDTYPSDASESEESEEEHEEVVCWRSGRRVVELGILVDNLEKGFAACGRPLDLRHCEDEKRNSTWGNSKVKKFNDVMSVLNIPTLHHATVKKSEIIVGRAVEDVATKACKNAAAEEIMLAKQGNACNMLQEISIAEFATWQRNMRNLKRNMIAEKIGKAVSKQWSQKCVSMLLELSESGLIVDTLTMDDDTTTIAKLRSEVDGSIKKISDKNHTVKHFTNKLYKLRTEKGYKQLNPRTIAHLAKCFTYAISQNRGDREATKKAIESIGPHVFGTHDLCDSNWCGYLKDSFSYKPNHLPYRKYFSGEELKNAFFEILQGFASQSRSFTTKRATYIDNEKDKKRKLEESVDYKRKRIRKKEEKTIHQSACSTRDGPTYETAVSLNNEVAQTNEIPPPQCPPKAVPLPSVIPVTCVFFDLETTGLERDSEIIQIAAACGEEQFHTYIIPRGRISTSATCVTGLAIKDGILYRNGTVVDTVDCQTG
ncbi:uncharacterized protein LOC125656697 [Ostrea edulis]|uniref:uncharacterized protein LOC125656697 n=1 Tax=Ostrea edulis TaxID=37623 RepID=UPI0024AF96A3|nr:uncharacterized protein LOC125656697 [Ostrea edulis]